MRGRTDRPSSPLGRAGLITCCAAVLLLPSLINGFPLVFSDTGTYLRSAYEGYVPADRPYWYGVFVRVTSGGGLSLWGVVIAQALWSAVLVVRTTGAVIGPRQLAPVAFLGCALLTIGSGLGWFAGQLIPDVFTGLGLLSIYLLVRRKGSLRARFFDAATILVACWMHLSNLMILPLAGGLLLLLSARSGIRAWLHGALRLAAVVAVTIGGLLVANRLVDGKAYVSRAGHAFLVARMVDTGMLRPYLEEHCSGDRPGLCAYLDRLPDRGDAFLWAADSPLMAQGGWDATREEYGRIVRGSLREPRYFWWHVRGSLASTTEQLGAWEINAKLANTWYRTPDSAPSIMIAKCMPHELDAYLGSLQNGGRGELDMRWPDRLYRATLVLALLVLAWAIVASWRGAWPEPLVFGVFAIGAVVIGAWACATLSAVDTRYLGRDSWLIPFAAWLVLADRWQRKQDATLPEGGER